MERDGNKKRGGKRDAADISSKIHAFQMKNYIPLDVQDHFANYLMRFTFQSVENYWFF